MSFPAQDRFEADALLTDRYLDALLAAQDRRASDTPADAALDPAVRFAAARLASDLDRVHPSFRFEERLAARLAEVAARMRLGLAAGGEGSQPPLGAPVGGFDPLVDPAYDAQPDENRPDLVRPLLIGGALTSAALSIAGAAFVAWRRARPPLSPMAWAVRAVGQARLTRGGTAGDGPGPRRLD